MWFAFPNGSLGKEKLIYYTVIYWFSVHFHTNSSRARSAFWLCFPSLRCSAPCRNPFGVGRRSFQLYASNLTGSVQPILSNLIKILWHLETAPAVPLIPSETSRDSGAGEGTASTVSICSSPQGPRSHQQWTKKMKGGTLQLQVHCFKLQKAAVRNLSKPPRCYEALKACPGEKGSAWLAAPWQLWSRLGQKDVSGRAEATMQLWPGVFFFFVVVALFVI